MRLLLQLAVRNVRRNTRRSILTALMITAGTGLLILGMAWVGGVLGDALAKGAALTGHIRVVTTRYSQKEQLFPIEENIPDTTAILAAVTRVPGITGAYPRITLPVTVTAGEEIGENFGLMQGASLDWLQDVMKVDQHLVEGRMMTADNEAVIGLTVASQTGAKLGDDIITLGQTQDGSMSPARLKVVGLYDLGSGNQNKLIYVTLEKARWIADIPDGATEVLAYTADHELALDITPLVRALPETAGLTTQSWAERPPFNGMLGIMEAIKFIATAVIVFITALGVLNTMLMSVMERTAEIGVLRAMGLKTRDTILMVVFEAFGIASIGGALGALGGGLVAWAWLERVGINLGGAVKGLPSAIPINSTVYGDLRPEMLVTAFLLGLVMALVGGVLPAIRATRIQPVEAMRSRR